jgi:hypothetical protein
MIDARTKQQALQRLSWISLALYHLCRVEPVMLFTMLFISLLALVALYQDSGRQTDRA